MTDHAPLTEEELAEAMQAREAWVRNDVLTDEELERERRRWEQYATKWIGPPDPSPPDSITGGAGRSQGFSSSDLASSAEAPPPSPGERAGW